MKRALNIAVVIVWVIVASVSLARLCLTYAAFALPIPERAWVWLFTTGYDCEILVPTCCKDSDQSDLRRPCH